LKFKRFAVSFIKLQNSLIFGGLFEILLILISTIIDFRLLLKLNEYIVSLEVGKVLCPRQLSFEKVDDDIENRTNIVFGTSLEALDNIIRHELMNLQLAVRK